MSEPIVPHIRPKTASGKHETKVYTLRDHIHTAFGYSVVNCTLIEGEDACILG